MDDLLLTRADRPRTRWTRALPRMAAPIGVLCLPAILAGEWLVVLWIYAGFTALATVLRLLVFWGWVRVDAAGISYSHTGVGQGRRLAWHEVGGIQVNLTRTQGGTLRTAKVLLRNGKRRTLPLLGDSEVNPDPDFDRKVASIQALASHYGVTALGFGATPLPLVLESEPAMVRWSESNRRWAWRYVTPFLLVPLVVSGVAQLGRAWTAQMTDTKPGTFTAVEWNADGSDLWAGNFVSGDGTVSRYGVDLLGDSSIEQPGDQVPAQNSGAAGVRAVADDEGGSWIGTAVMTLILGGLLANWIRVVLLPSLWKRRGAVPGLRSGPMGS